MDTAHWISTGNPSPALQDLLLQKWKTPTTQGGAAAKTRSESDAATGAITADSATLYNSICALVERKAPGSENITLLSVSPEGVVVLLHSLLVIRDNAYDEDTVLWEIQGHLPETDLHNLVALHPIDFAPVSPFPGTDMATFESHVTGLRSTDFEDLDEMAHTPMHRKH